MKTKDLQLLIATWILLSCPASTSAQDASECGDSIEIHIEARSSNESQINVSIHADWEQQSEVYLTEVYAKIASGDRTLLRFPIYVNNGSNSFAYGFVLSIEATPDLELGFIYAKGGKNKIIVLAGDEMEKVVARNETVLCL